MAAACPIDCLDYFGSNFEDVGFEAAACFDGFVAAVGIGC